MTRTARGHRGGDGTAKRARASQHQAKTSNDSARSAGAVRAGRDRLVSMSRSLLSNLSVRTRIAALVIAPLLCTLVLGSIFFKGALDEASSASKVESLADVGRTAVDALSAVQDERDITGLAESGGTGAGAVSEARASADAALATLGESIEQHRDGDLGGAFATAVATYDRETGKLADYRLQRDSANPAFDEGGAVSYHVLAEALIDLITAAGSVTDDPSLARQVASLADVSAATEAASMERGLIAHTVEPGEVPTPAQRDLATAWQGEQNVLVGRFVDGLAFVKQVRFSSTLALGARAAAPTRSQLRSGDAVQSTKEAWYAGATTNVDGLRQIQEETAQTVEARASAATSGARWTAALTALAVIAVIALTVFLTVVVARSVVGPLRRLRASALESSKTHLPELVSRIHRDGPTAARDVPHAVAAEGRDEIGQVATAFNDVHATAVQVASEQALLRQNLDSIVVNLSRRTQSLVDRQLGEIEGLEHRERDPDQLSTLFRIDHMATRVRRHAESLLILAGVDEMRKHGAAAGVLDVVRTAVGEVEQYPRVKFGVMPTDLVAAGAVDDIAHLLAELIDNATEFSAPATPVRVTSQPLLGGGLRLQVSDSGLGVPSAQLVELNERLGNVSDIDVAGSRTLGLYVVARLAAKHGIRVRLEAEPDGGTAAQVDLPAHLILSPLDTSEGAIAAVTPQTVVPPSGSGGDSDTSERPVWPPAEAPRTDRPAAHAGASGGLLSDSPTWEPPLALARPDTNETNGVGHLDFTTHSTPSAAAAPSTPASPSQPTPSVAAPTPPPSRPSPAQHAAYDSSRVSEPSEAAVPDSSSPIFDSVASAWFRQSSATEDWSSPADEGWRRAAEALRSAEEAASARRVQRDTLPIAGSSPTTGFGSGWARDRAAGRPAAHMTDERPAAHSTGERPAASNSGLPTRQRGASLVPGSIAGANDAAARPARPAAQVKDAKTVASTLSSLQRGVGRGREETGGWVPKRPSDPERSNS